MVAGLRDDFSLLSGTPARAGISARHRHHPRPVAVAVAGRGADYLSARRSGGARSRSGSGAIINALDITFVPIGSNLAVPFYIDLELRYFLVPAVITLLMTAGASLVPLLRTARISVATVLRHD